MKTEIIEGLIFEISITNVLERREFNKIYTIEISELYYMVDKLVRNNKDFISDNEERICLFQHFIKRSPRNVYDMYLESMHSYIETKNDKEGAAKEFNSVLIPIVIVALKNNFEENSKINIVKERNKVKIRNLF